MSDLFNYQIKGSSADGDLISVKMSQLYERAYVFITFFTDGTFQTPATPAGGTLTITASEDGTNFGTVPNGTVAASNPAYDRPNFSGPVRFVKATALGITGAPFYIATISKYRG